MQTFLPYPDFEMSAKCLDYKRLGKQRVEAKQIIDILEGKATSNAWKNHPAVLMWQNSVDLLKLYCNTMIEEWVYRGYKNNMELYKIPPQILFYLINPEVTPTWFGEEKFHSAHRQTLLFKDLKHYSQFGWKEEPKYEYWWPTKHSTN